MGSDRFQAPTRRRSWLTRAATAAMALAAAAAQPAFAQANDFPTRPIKMVVPFGAGGSDAMARSFAEKLGAVLKQPVFVENRPGAAALIGAEYTAAAAPDGYTMIFLGGGSLTPVLLKDLKFDIQKQLKPVVCLARGGMMFMVNSGVPAKNMDEFVKYAKQNPGKLNYSYTAGSMVLSDEMLKSKLGFDATAVPYKGAGQVLTALISNEIQMTIDVPFNYLPMIKDGKVRPLLHGGQERSPSLPEVPTLSDMGINDLIFAVSYGIWVPAGTPDPIVARLNAAYNEVLKDPEIRGRLVQASVVPVGGPPSGQSEQIRMEQDMWARSARQIGYKPE